MTKAKKSPGPKQAAESKSLKDAYRASLRPILDNIDSVRSLLKGQDIRIDFPSIVVLGDQSAGKSSVLEAMSFIQLPRGSGMVTRAAIVLQLRSAEGEEERIEVSYSDKAPQIVTSEELEEVLRKAQRDLTGDDYGVTHEQITVRVEAPGLPDLTLIDLPGLIQIRRPNQPEDIVERIRSLVDRYVLDPNAILLAMVNGASDPETSIALKIASEVDHTGRRTVVINTKADLISQEAELVRRCTSLVTHFQPLAFIPVRCRNQEELDSKLSIDASRAQERQFFSDLRYRHRQLKVRAEQFATEAQLRGLGQLVESVDDALDRLAQLLRLLTDSGRKLVEGAFFELESIHAALKSVAASDDIQIMRIAREAILTAEHDLTHSLPDFRAPEFLQRIEAEHRALAGTQLDGHPSYRVFMSLYKAAVQSVLEAPLLDLLADLQGSVQRALTLLAQAIFKEEPRLLPSILGGIGEYVEGCKAETEEAVLAMVSDCAEPTGYLRGLETKNGHEHHNHNHHEHQEDVPSETYKELIEKLEPLSKKIVFETLNVVNRAVIRRLVRTAIHGLGAYLWERLARRGTALGGGASDEDEGAGELYVSPAAQILMLMQDDKKAFLKVALKEKARALRDAAARLGR